MFLRDLFPHSMHPFTELIDLLQHEKVIYRRLGKFPGIIRCHNLSSDDHSIQMDHMGNGDLRHYLIELETRPGKKVQLFWFMALAQTLAYVHGRCVIVADFRSDNCLLDDQLFIKLGDFGESSLMPLDWDLAGDDDGYSILTDLGQFGALMFEVVTGRSCKFNLMQDWKDVGDPITWPRRETLPSTKDIWLGHIIEKCWTQGFSSAKDLAGELGKVDVS